MSISKLLMYMTCSCSSSMCTSQNTGKQADGALVTWSTQLPMCHHLTSPNCWKKENYFNSTVKDLLARTSLDSNDAQGCTAKISEPQGNSKVRLMQQIAEALGCFQGPMSTRIWQICALGNNRWADHISDECNYMTGIKNHGIDWRIAISLKMFSQGVRCYLVKQTERTVRKAICMQ